MKLAMETPEGSYVPSERTSFRGTQRPRSDGSRRPSDEPLPQQPRRGDSARMPSARARPLGTAERPTPLPPTVTWEQGGDIAGLRLTAHAEGAAAIPDPALMPRPSLRGTGPPVARRPVRRQTIAPQPVATSEPIASALSKKMNVAGTLIAAEYADIVIHGVDSKLHKAAAKYAKLKDKFERDGGDKDARGAAAPEYAQITSKLARMRDVLGRYEVREALSLHRMYMGVATEVMEHKTYKALAARADKMTQGDALDFMMDEIADKDTLRLEREHNMRASESILDVIRVASKATELATRAENDARVFARHVEKLIPSAISVSVPVAMWVGAAARAIAADVIRGLHEIPTQDEKVAVIRQKTDAAVDHADYATCPSAITCEDARRVVAASVAAAVIDAVRQGGAGGGSKAPRAATAAAAAFTQLQRAPDSAAVAAARTVVGITCGAFVTEAMPRGADYVIAIATAIKIVSEVTRDAAVAFVVADTSAGSMPSMAAEQHKALQKAARIAPQAYETAVAVAAVAPEKAAADTKGGADTDPMHVRLHYIIASMVWGLYLNDRGMAIRVHNHMESPWYVGVLEQTNAGTVPVEDAYIAVYRAVWENVDRGAGRYGEEDFHEITTRLVAEFTKLRKARKLKTINTNMRNVVKKHLTRLLSEKYVGVQDVRAVPKKTLDERTADAYGVMMRILKGNQYLLFLCELSLNKREDETEEDVVIAATLYYAKTNIPADALRIMNTPNMTSAVARGMFEKFRRTKAFGPIADDVLATFRRRRVSRDDKTNVLDAAAENALADRPDIGRKVRSAFTSVFSQHARGVVARQERKEMGEAYMREQALQVPEDSASTDSEDEQQDASEGESYYEQDDGFIARSAGAPAQSRRAAYIASLVPSEAEIAAYLLATTLSGKHRA